jgi:hypothetical protein
MMLVSFVLKLFISSHLLKLEGVLCIYVLLFHKRQAKNYLLCFSIWFEHTFDFHCFIFMIFHLCSFSCYDMVAKFLLSRLCLSSHVLSSFDPSTQCLHRWSRLCRCMSPQKIFFCYHLPSRGRAGVKLGDVWYVSNVSTIFDALCLFLHHLLSVLLLTRVNPANVLDKGLWIGGRGHRMNSKVKLVKNRCVSKANLGVQPGFLSIWPTLSPTGPYI